MAQVRGTQRREPFGHSRADSSHWDHFIDSEEFVVKKQGKAKINVFFCRSIAPDQGVGLLLPSPEVAIALARALISVAEGQLSEARGRF